MVQEAAAQTYAMIGDTIPSDVPGLFAIGVRQPAGVVIGIAPWNAPLILTAKTVHVLDEVRIPRESGTCGNWLRMGQTSTRDLAKRSTNRPCVAT